MERVAATRTGLLSARSRARIARRGVAILRGKRAALADEFFRLMRGVAAARKRLDATMVEAARALAIARASDGDARLDALAAEAGRALPIEVSARKVWGVATAEVIAPKLARRPAARGTPLGDWSLAGIEAARLHEDAIQQMLGLAAQEPLARRLGAEIRETTRRINAIEQVVLPSLAAETRRIRLALEQHEADENVRRRRFKQRRR